MAERKTGLIEIYNCHNPKRNGDIIFVHGLGDHYIQAWYPNPKEIDTRVDTEEFAIKDLPELDFWLYWLSQERKDLAIKSYSYEAKPFKKGGVFGRLGEPFKGEGNGIYDLANEFRSYLELDDHRLQPRIFICHSLGGLIVKKVLQIAYNNRETNGFNNDILENTKGIVFLGTPHQGSKLANLEPLVVKFTKTVFGIKKNPILEDLRAEQLNTELYELREWYKNNSSLKFATKAFYEGLETQIPVLGKTRIVDRDSSNPGVQGESPIAVNKADHFSLCKPKKANDSIVYLRVKDFIKAHLVKQEDEKKKTLSRETLPSSTTT